MYAGLESIDLWPFVSNALKSIKFLEIKSVAGMEVILIVGSMYVCHSSFTGENNV